MTVRSLLSLFALARSAALRRPPLCRRARGRRALMYGLAAFALATSMFAGALDFRYHSIRYPEHALRLANIQRQHAHAPERPLVLVIGSSRTQNAVNPSAMGFHDQANEPLVFNYGMSGIPPREFLTSLQRLLDAGVQPAAVVVEIFPALLHAEHLSIFLEPELAIRYTAAELIRIPPGERTSQIQRAWLHSRIFCWSRFGRATLLAAAPEWVVESALPVGVSPSIDENGYAALRFDPVDVKRYGAIERSRSDYLQLCATLQLGAEAERSYREIAKVCRSRGVPVAFYLSAESPTFQSWYTPEARAALEAFLQILKDDLGVPVFDLSDGWSDDDFFDGHHMLAPAAARFSKRFADDHLRPWLRSVQLCE